MKTRHIFSVNCLFFYFFLHFNYSINAQLASTGKSLGFLYNQDNITIELLIVEPSDPCADIGKSWLYKIKTKNVGALNTSKQFLNWKLRVKNCNNYLIERNFSVDVHSINNFKNDGAKGNTQDWKFEAKSIEGGIIDGGLYATEIKEKDRNLDNEKLLPPDTIFGLREVLKGEVLILSIPKNPLFANANWVWYYNDCGLGNVTPLFIGKDYSFTPTRDMVLFVRAEDGNRFSGCKKIQIKLYEKSIAPTEILTTAGLNEIYLGEKQDLRINSGKLGTDAKWIWYEKKVSGNERIGIGERINIAPSKTTTYEVRAESPFEFSSSKTITISVIAEELFWNNKNLFAKTNNCFNKQVILTDKKINTLITAILEKFQIENTFQLLNCDDILACKSVFYDVPYLILNSNFLKNISKLNLLKAQEFENEDWQNLYILAHELGYLMNNQFIKKDKSATFRQIEIQADRNAGKILFFLGASLEQVLNNIKNFNINNISNRQLSQSQKSDAIKQGFLDTKNNQTYQNINTIISKSATSSCGSSILMDIDGNSYPIVQIGGQCWMRENLIVNRYRNEDTIPYIIENNKWQNHASGARSYFNHTNANISTFGNLYNWYAVDDSRGICPKGWHVPTKDDWIGLTNSLGGENLAGGKLKSTIDWNTPNLGATNESGFSAIPNPYRDEVGNFAFIKGGIASFWVSKEGKNGTVFDLNLEYNSSKVNIQLSSKGWGQPVRCIKDMD
jgi:uncharacterized protein (TIGR02145 family)